MEEYNGSSDESMSYEDRQEIEQAILTQLMYKDQPKEEKVY